MSAQTGWEIGTAETPAARRVARIRRRPLAMLVRLTLAAECAPPLAVSVTLVDDAEIRVLNRAWLGRDRVTDVISFEIAAAGRGAPAGGDVYVSLERAREQARERRRPLERELRLLVVHGVLHALGHDDERAAARRVMQARERVVLRAAAKTVPPLLAAAAASAAAAARA